MLDAIWNTRSYLFWLMAASLFCLLLERVFPWRKEQRLLRPQWSQDLFFLFFNGQFFGLLLARVVAALFGWVPDDPGPHLLGAAPLWVQFGVFFLVKDFLEWCVHYCLHRVRWLWQFHKLHHSIVELDWIGNFRFHWMEIVLYRALTYLPLMALGVSDAVLLPIAVLSTLIGHLNHANVKISWGPLRYLLNSSRMHVWHHDMVKHHRYGQNYGIVFSLWDWLFGTAYWPADRLQPDQLGFGRMASFPRRLLPRLIYPFWRGRGTSIALEKGEKTSRER